MFWIPVRQALVGELLTVPSQRSRLYPSEDVHTHLIGAAILIKSCCNQLNRKQPGNTPDTSNLAHILALEAFIFHAATSVPFQSPPCRSDIVDDAFVRAVDTLQRLLGRGTIESYKSPVLGAPPRIFAYVRQTALLYQRFKGNSVLETQQCLELDEDLTNWDDKSFVADFSNQNSAFTASSIDETTRSQTLCLSTLPPSGDTLLPGLRLYVLTTRILLNHMMKPGNILEPSISILTSEALSLVLRIDPAEDYFADYYVWPFFCLGVIVTSSHQKDVIMDKIVSFWERTRNGPMRLLGDMLRHEWKQPKRHW